MTSIYFVSHTQDHRPLETQTRTRLTQRFSAIPVHKVICGAYPDAQEIARAIAVCHGAVPLKREGWQVVPEESVERRYVRCGALTRSLVKEFGGQTIVIVASEEMIRCALCRAQGYPLERLDELPPHPQTAVSHLMYTASRFSLAYAADLSHLRERSLGGEAGA